MSEAFLKIFNMSISAGWLVLAVLVLRLLLKKAPKWVWVLLWGIVALRLLCPFPVESALSLIPSAETVSPEIMLDRTPEIFTGVETLDRVVNPVISASFAPEPAASANPLQILIPVAANLWLLGMLVMALYTAASYLTLRRKLRTAVIHRDNIFRSEYAASPFVLGIIKPRIYLPYGLAEQNLEYVIAHEQAHIRRKDHWWKPLGFLLLSVHWFNPLMWLAYILLCRDIELACDEKVIASLCRQQRADYTQALVVCSIHRPGIAACPLAFGEVGVKTRVKSIMNYRKPAFWLVAAAIVSCVAVAVCFLTDPKDTGTPEPMLDALSAQDVQWAQVTLWGEETEHILLDESQIRDLVGILNDLAAKDFVRSKVPEHDLSLMIYCGELELLLHWDGAYTEFQFDSQTAEGIDKDRRYVCSDALNEFLEAFLSMTAAEDRTVSDSASTYEIYNVAPLEELPDTYSLEEATIDKCVIIVDGDIRDNADVWADFISRVDSGEEASVRIVQYDHGEDAASMYIQELTFDGEKYQLRWFENGQEYIKKYQYLRYCTGDAETESADYDAYVRYILTDDADASWQELFLSTASSAAGATIDYYVAYTDLIYYPDEPGIPDGLTGAELYAAQDDALMAAYTDESQLQSLRQLLSSAEALGYQPQTYWICCELVLRGADGSTAVLELDAYSDGYILDGVYFDYGPGYDDDGSLDATSELLAMLGLAAWP